MQHVLKVPVEIHLLMQDADDIDAFAGRPIKQHMRSCGIFAIALADMSAAFSAHGRCCNDVYRFCDQSHISLGLIDASRFDSVIPDAVEIRLGTRRTDEAAHFAALSPLRLRAMKASKSNAVEAPLFSPSISAALSAARLASRSSSSRRPARTTSLADAYRPSATLALMKSAK